MRIREGGSEGWEERSIVTSVKLVQNLIVQIVQKCKIILTNGVQFQFQSASVNIIYEDRESLITIGTR